MGVVTGRVFTVRLEDSTREIRFIVKGIESGGAWLRGCFVGVGTWEAIG